MNHGIPKPNPAPVGFAPPKEFVPPEKGERILCEETGYYIGDFIANGGFGAVYECTDDWGNNLIAKVLLPQNKTYEQVKDEWQTELRNLVQLRHPNITFIYQAFEYRNTFYLIVERCSFPLISLIERRNDDGDKWLPYIARDVLHALDFIHKLGYVHKDLHPGNIFVSHRYDYMNPSKDREWSFKIGDLGISRLAGDMRPANTIFAQWMTPPEHLDPAKFGAVGKHIDIYQTGLLLLSLLLKDIPMFTKKDIMNGIPSKLAEAIPSPCGKAIAKSLRRHVEDRTPNAIAMWRDISDAITKKGNKNT
jgi:serine/threonine-protein kinase